MCACVRACVSGRLLMARAGLVVSFSLSPLMNDLPRRARSLSLSASEDRLGPRLAAVPMATRLHQALSVPSMADILIS